MQKRLKVTGFLLLLIFMTACGATQADESAALVPDSSQASGVTAELSPEMQLIVGTLELEETEYAVTSDQAADLLPLWQVYRTLIASSTAAPEELEALVGQISDAMSDAQLIAIEEMDLSREDMTLVADALGLMPEIDPGSATGQGEDAGFQRPEGMPQGVGPGGGGGGGKGGGLGAIGVSPEEMESFQATREAGGGGAGFSGGIGMIRTNLIDAVIELLQSK